MNILKIKVLLFFCIILVVLTGCINKPVKPILIIDANRNAASSVIGHWEGTIQIMSFQLVMDADFQMSNQFLTATMNSVSQNSGNIPVQITVLNATNVVFELYAPMKGPAVFNGAISGNTIGGGFNQGGVKGTFSLTKTAVSNSSEAPDPNEKTVTVETPTGKLFGTLNIPKGKKIMPVYIIIAGSGPTDRNGNSILLPGKNNTYQMIARGLSRLGIATLRYDKRGIGESRDALKSENGLTFEDNVKDVQAWVEFLKKDGSFSKIGLIGHSEGSLVGMIAATNGGIDYMVSIAGPGRPIDVILNEQTSKAPEKQKQEIEKMLSLLKQGKKVWFVPNDMMSLFRPSIQPYMISWLKYDPARVAFYIKCPFLVLQGTTDLQVKPDDAKLLAAANPRAKLVLIDGMNHVMKMAPMDEKTNMAAYSDPKLPLAEGIIKNIADLTK